MVEWWSGVVEWWGGGVVLRPSAAGWVGCGQRRIRSQTHLRNSLHISSASEAEIPPVAGIPPETPAAAGSVDCEIK